MLDLKSLIPFHHNDKTREVAKPSDAPRDLFLAMRREMNHMFDNFLSGRELAPMEMSLPTTPPSLEVTDGEKEMTITAELPGMDEKDVDVRISGDLLTIEGEKSEESEKKEGERTYSERSYGKFSRTIRLPFSITDENIDASYEKGVLNIKLEKPAEQQSKVKHIDIKTS